MALFEEQITDTLETGAPSIKYTGKEGPRPSMQSQEEMMMARQIWDAMGDQEKGQFSNFEEFFASGIWKQILQQMQQDEGQGITGLGPQGPQGPQGIAGLGPRNMEQQMPMPNRMGAQYGGRIGFQGGLGAGDESALMKEVQFLVKVMGMSPEQALQRVQSQSEGSFPRPELKPAELRPEFRPNYQAPLRPRSRLGMRPPEEIEEIGIETLRGRR